MNVLIAKTVDECKQWTDVAVVVDVLRASTTLCSLLERGKKEVLVFDQADRAESFVKAHSDFEVYSDMDLSVSHEDNSPYLASKSNARRPALLVTAEGTPAMLCVREASLVLLGGFCNFYALAEALAAQTKDVLLVPSSLFGVSDDVEDGLCVAALKDYIQGIGSPQEAIVEFNNTMRYGEFMKQGPKTADKDAKLAFKVNGIPVVPQVSFSAEGYGVCHVYGQPAPAQWLGQQAAPAVQQPADEPEPTVRPDAETPAPDAVIPAEELPAEPTAPIPAQTAEQAAEKSAENTAPRPAAAPETAPAQEPNPPQEPSADSAAQVMAQKGKQAAEALRKEAAAVKESLAAAKESAGKKLKGFFSGIIQAVKEEKAELEREIAPQKPAPLKSDIPQSDDLLDAVLKKTEKTSAPEPAAQTPAQTPENPTVRQPVRPDASAAVPAGEVTFAGQAAGFGHKKRKKAIVLFSGGLDSTTCLYWAIAHGYKCEALTVSYGQRHDREVLAAQMIARNLGVKHHLITLNLPWLSCCSLVDKKQELPDVAVEDIPKEGIPSTYVPGRNLMFLAIAGSLLDSVGADAIIAGPNAVDFSGYPDCTPAFFKAAADALNRGTKTGVSEGIEVLAPLMRLSKAQIVKLAANLKVPFELTWSCYAGGQKPCGHCDSCKLRAKGFAEAGVHDTSLD